MIAEFVDHLQKLNFVESSILIPGTLGFIVAVLPWLRDKLGMKLASDVNDGFSEGFSAIALFFVFIAAASLASVQGFQKDGAKAVETEINAIQNLDRDLTRINTPQAIAARVALKQYVRAVIDDEWPKLADGEESEKVTHLVGDVIKQINHMENSSPKDAMVLEGLEKLIANVADARSERVEVANEHLNPIYWGLVFAFIGLLIVVSAFTHVSLSKRASLCGKMVAISFSLVMLIQTDGVFSGDIAIKPTGFEKLAKKLAARTLDSE
jgi:hypothetical protein